MQIPGNKTHRTVIFLAVGETQTGPQQNITRTSQCILTFCTFFFSIVSQKLADESNAGKVMVDRQDPGRMKEVAKKAGAEIKLVDDL